MKKIKTNKGYGLIILLITVAIITFLAVSFLGRNGEENKNEDETITTQTGARGAIQKADYSRELENRYNSDIQAELGK